MKHRLKKGRWLAIGVLLILMVNEAVIYWLNASYQPERVSGQYFCWLLTIPVLPFFYRGFTWALWLVRLALLLGVLASAILMLVLRAIAEDPAVGYLAVVLTALNVCGLWVLFGSRSFRAHLWKMRRKRGLYD